MNRTLSWSHQIECATTAPVKAADFDFDLPQALIAQHPVEPRDASRMLVLCRRTGQCRHCQFRDFPELLNEGDLLIVNDSRVMKARLEGECLDTGRLFDILLIREQGANDWWALMKPGKRARIGMRLRFSDHGGVESVMEARITEISAEGHRRLVFEGGNDIKAILEHVGKVPLPPYIKRSQADPGPEDESWYQTVYASVPGSVAAPTAGLHFTEQTLHRLRSRGVVLGRVTLHVGLGTFAPVKLECVSDHQMHEEWYELPEAIAEAVARTREQGGRVIAVGTTSVRVLECVAGMNAGRVTAHEGWTKLFIYPPYRFGVVDGMLTNFHLPRSTLLMLVSAFAAPGEERGREMVMTAYQEAVARRYRFYSYGDAMMIL